MSHTSNLAYLLLFTGSLVTCVIAVISDGFLTINASFPCLRAVSGAYKTTPVCLAEPGARHLG
jgi:hypothetical protein